MRKFLVMVALVAIAAWLVNHRLLTLWRQDRPAEGAKTRSTSSPVAGAKQEAPPPAPLTDGLAMEQEGRHAEAIPVLVREIEELEGKSSPDAPRHVAALARCYDAVNNAEKAEGTWKRLLARYPDAPEKAEAHLWLMKNARSEEERARHLGDVLACPGDSEAKRVAATRVALKLAEEEGKEVEARANLSKVLRAGLPKDLAEEVKGVIVRLNQKLLWSRRETSDAILYVVKAGDTLTQIAQRHKTTVGLIMRINRLPNTRIREGDRLKLFNCEGCELIIRKSELTLQLWWKGIFVKEYPICIGDPENSPTPEGEHAIMSRIENPPWSRDGETIPPGDPRNILGTRWMGFKELRSYGIHGTTQPETVPGRMSAGCVRMRNEDVEEVYDFAIEGTRVTILP